MNANWQRWIYASVTKHFYDILAVDGQDIWIEGQQRKDGVHYVFEIRMDGPYAVETCKGQYTLKLSISVTVQTKMDNDFHLHQRNLGKAQAAFTPIVLYKHGDGSEILGCLQLDNQNNSGIVTRNFGQVSPDLAIEQGYVESRFKTHLEEVS